MDSGNQLSPGRISPISPPERDLLIGLISEEKILQNRKKDGRVLKQKREAWTRITSNFNAHNLGPKRTEQQLRKVWERLKVKMKHEHATKQVSPIRNGGGAPPPDLPQESDKILDSLGPEINDIGNPYDDDARSSMELSYSSVCEVAAIDEGLSLVSQPPAPSQESSQPPHHTSKKYTYRNARQQQDNELYDVPEDLRNGTSENAMQSKFLERRQHLLELQIKHMEIRIAEGEERREEAKIWREIAQKELEKVLVTSATTLTAPPHMDHTYIHDRPERGDAVTVGVQTDPLKTTYKGSSFSSAMRSPSIVISAGEDDAFHGTFRREGIPLMSNISHLITPSSSHSSSTDDASVSGVSPSMTSSSVQKKRKKASQPENFNVTREKVDSVHHSQRVVQATTDFVSGFMRLLAEKQQRKFANKIMKLVQEHQASADDCAA